MSFTLTIELANKSGDTLTKKSQTKTSGRFETEPPPELAAKDGTGEVVAVGGSFFETQVWYGHGQAASRGASVTVSGEQVSTSPSDADVKVVSSSKEAATVSVTFG